MKLSDKTINLCKIHFNKFSTCISCPIEEECALYRSSSIYLYEELKLLFEQIESKVKIS